MSRRPSGQALAVIAILGSAGIMHWVKPEFFDPLVPSWMPGSARLVTHVSGAAEFTAAVLIAIPQTRRIGGWLALATFAAVFPANIAAAVDGGMHHLDPPMNSAAAAWIRLPFQLPLFWLALQVAKPTPR